MGISVSPNSKAPLNGNHVDTRPRAAVEQRVASLAKAPAQPPGPLDETGWDEDLQPVSDDGSPQQAVQAVPATAILVDADEYERIQTEHEQLRTQLAELERGASAAWAEKEKDYEALLEEKSELIRGLHQTIAELEDRPAAPAANVPREEELLALSEELERERKQLKDDEESLMKQMRDMEVTMSKERAELARHRTEMQRLHTEFRHEMELASRDASLRERLAPLQRKHQEMINRKGGAPSAAAKAPDAPVPAPQQAVKGKKDSGLIRRLFG